MSTSIVERVNTGKTVVKSNSVSAHKLEVVKSVISNSSTLVTSEEVARQIKTASDLLIRQLERLCNILKELRQAPPKRNEQTSRLF